MNSLEHFSKTADLEPLVTFKRAAETFGIPTYKVRRAAKAGLIPTYGIYNSRRLVRLSELAAVISASRQGGQS